MTTVIHVSTITFGKKSWYHSLHIKPSTNCITISKSLIFPYMSSLSDIIISEVICSNLGSICERRIEDIRIASNIQSRTIDPLQPCLSDNITIYSFSTNRENSHSTSEDKGQSNKSHYYSSYYFFAI